MRSRARWARLRVRDRYRPGGPRGQQLGTFGGQDPQHEMPVLLARAHRVGFGGLGEAGPGQRGLPEPVEHSPS